MVGQEANLRYLVVCPNNIRSIETCEQLCHSAVGCLHLLKPTIIYNCLTFGGRQVTLLDDFGMCEKPRAL